MRSASFINAARSSAVGGGGGALEMAMTTSFGASACFKWISADQTSQVREKKTYSETQKKCVNVVFGQTNVFFFVGEFGKVEGSLLLLDRTSGKTLHG